jgi:hypothetical protein
MPMAMIDGQWPVADGRWPMADGGQFIISIRDSAQDRGLH